MPKYDYDSYLLYEMKKRPVHLVKIRVILNEPVNGEVLRKSAIKAFKRFPYFSKTVAVDDQDGYILLPCDKPIVVIEGDKVIRLGTEETNRLLFAISYENCNVFFSFGHNFCGANGAMKWIKTTLWQYFTDLGYDVEKADILTPDDPITPEEVAEPDIASLPLDEPLGDLTPPTGSYFPAQEYIARMRDPNGIDGYYPITIPKKEFMKYARDNDGSPNSIIIALLFKTHTKALPDEQKFTGAIINNYSADVGCPKTYRDIIRAMHVQFDASMKDFSIEKLSTITRSRMYLQMQPEISWDFARQLNEIRNQIDAQPDLNSKEDYAVAHSLTGKVPSSFHVSYVGKVDWGGLASFIDGVFTLTLGHLLLEVNATEEDFCISFQTYRKDNKYIKEFLEVLDEEHIHYSVGPFLDRKLPKVIMP